jgi:hypothetical protein
MLPLVGADKSVQKGVGPSEERYEFGSSAA